MMKPLLIAGVLGLIASASGEKISKPNIVVIYADDLGYGDVQCYNPERGKIPTPHIDRFASQGMRFTDAHSSSAVCSPSRYALLTGRYHWRTRLQAALVPMWGSPLITPDRLTIGGLAQKNGYRTACIGKWHLGSNWPIPPEDRKFFGGYGKDKLARNAKATDEYRAAWKRAFSQPISGGPVAVGFDSYFGVDIPNWPPFCFIENDRTVGIPSELLPETQFDGLRQASDQGPALPDWKLEAILPALEERAVAFIEHEAKTPEPFLLYLPLTAPHTPLAVNEPWKGKSGLGLYGDFVMETDAMIGTILEALEKSRVAKNTLVVFTSDNGTAQYIGVPAMEQKGHFPSGPLRGYKSDAWEGGHRIPFIVRWPAEVEPGVVNDQLVHQTDLLATFADVMGATLPDNAGEDSFSILPLLKGDNGIVRKDAVSCSHNGVPSLRMGSWKYIAGSGAGPLTTAWKKKIDGAELYNLANDMGETKNVAAQYPERVKAMQALLEQIIVRGRSTPGPEQKNDVEVRRYLQKPSK